MNTRTGQVIWELTLTGFLVWFLILGILKLTQSLDARFKVIDQRQSQLTRHSDLEDSYDPLKN